MAALCTVPEEGGFVAGLLGAVDCNVASLVEGSYARMADPAGPVSMVLTALLTLYVAFIGYRMLLGKGGLDLGSTAAAGLKIGIVLTLATSWAAYHTVIYETLYKGPQQLGTAILASQPSDSAFRGDPVAGLQLAVDELQAGAEAMTAASGALSPFLGGKAFAAMVLNMSAFLLLLSAVGTLLAAKIVLALLLALGPAVAGLLLFDATRGMVEGWLRAMVACAIAPLAVTVLLAAELAMLEPGLIALARMREMNEYETGPATMLALLIAAFTFVYLAALIAGGMIARGIRLPGAASAAVPRTASSAAPAAALQPLLATAAQPRTARIVAAAEASTRRDARAAASGLAADRRTSITTTAERGATASSAAHAPLGHSFRRPVRPRRSAVSQRRDR
jgi:type IV secretion system protein VirB6